ncbi:unnamed protein product [Anisakis simplex]|uniref:Secreted protein n=1 Tax=Anisakis simplex TaxID=6269 RepID=A0A0M3K7X9_ANISI|nr:unnamed protein product [Anisakis simplex]
MKIALSTISMIYFITVTCLCPCVKSSAWTGSSASGWSSSGVGSTEGSSASSWVAGPVVVQSNSHANDGCSCESTTMRSVDQDDEGVAQNMQQHTFAWVATAA